MDSLGKCCRQSYEQTKDFPFVLVSADCLSDANVIVLAHEVGHIAGAMHDDDPTPGAHHAYVRPYALELSNVPRRTIMSVTCETCYLGAIWSDPNSRYCYSLANASCSPFNTTPCGFGQCRSGSGICIPSQTTICQNMGVVGYSDALSLWKSSRPRYLANMPKTPKAGSLPGVAALLLLD